MVYDTNGVLYNLYSTGCKILRFKQFWSHDFDRMGSRGVIGHETIICHVVGQRDTQHEIKQAKLILLDWFRGYDSTRGESKFTVSYIETQ